VARDRRQVRRRISVTGQFAALDAGQTLRAVLLGQASGGKLSASQLSASQLSASQLWAALAWSAGILAVSVLLSIALFRRRTG
jgi:hypothetical protein